MACPSHLPWLDIRMIKSGKVRSRSVSAEVGNAFDIFVGEPEGKRPYGRSKSTLDDNIKLDLKKGGLRAEARSTDQWRAVVITVINFPVPYRTRICYKLSDY
jgi:hypothetical protein